LDPYFALIFDVYYRKPIIPAEERRRLYGDDVLAFETSAQGNKDRFLIGDLPVRIEYKDVGKINELVTIADSQTDHLWLIKDSGTYGFYRLAQEDVLFHRSPWIDEIRQLLSNCPKSL